MINIRTENRAIIDYDWDEYTGLFYIVLKKILDSNVKYDCVVAIIRGGFYLGDYLARKLELPLATIPVKSYTGQEPHEVSIGRLSIIDDKFNEVMGRALLVDDMVDSGKTMFLTMLNLKKNARFSQIDSAVIWKKDTSVLVPTYYASKTDKWINQPFEV